MRKKHPADLSQREWTRIESYSRVSYRKGGRSSKYSKREILEAIFYVLCTGVNGGIYYVTGYQGENLKNHIKEEYGMDIEIVKRPSCRF